MKKYKTPEQRFEELVRFWETEKRMPTYKSNNKHEKSLYSWIQAMKMAKRGHGTASYPNWLDQKAKEVGINKWFLVLDKAKEQFQDLLLFRKEFKRKPKRYKSRSKREAKLAHWIHQMRQERKEKTARYPIWLDKEAERHGILNWFITKKKGE